jgi:hypothetical protein
MSKQNYRAIEVDGRKYQWKAGRAFVKIQGMQAVPHSDKQPFPGSTIHVSDDGMQSWAIGPKQVADYIRSQVSGA